MNKKGFTLVELLAVIIILSLLALLASTSVSKIVKDSKSDLYDTQINLIKSAAEAWGADNLYDLPDAGTCKYLTLKDLKQYGLIEPEIKDPRTNKLFSDSLIIKISGEENKYGLNNISYEVDSNDVVTCRAVYPVCTLVENGDVAPEGISPGDKYQCKVKDEMEEEFKNGYYFYVLSHEEDGTTNLIMDQNIYSDGTPAGTTGVMQSENANKYNLVAWISDSTHGCGSDGDYCATNEKGPITAMQFLYNATKDWTNIDPVNYTYNNRIVQGNADGEGYISFISNNGVATITPLTGEGVTIGSEATPLRARMPIYSSDTTITEVTSKTNASYLYDNLDPEGMNAPYGYWTLSSHAYYSDRAWYVAFGGFVSRNGVGLEDYYGVRLVINVRL